jgi:transketolase
VVEHSKSFEIGRAETLSRGADVGIIVYGMLLKEAWEAKELLEAKGVGVRLVNLRTVKPLDEASVIDALRGTRLTVTVEDHFVTGGLFSIVSELCLRNGIAPRVMPIGLDNQWFKAGRLSEVLEYEGFTGPQIAARISAKLEKV